MTILEEAGHSLIADVFSLLGEVVRELEKKKEDPMIEKQSGF
jgi:hypothetical protein